MDFQPTFAELEMGAGRPRETRRGKFLVELGEACPWAAWEALVADARARDAASRGREPGMGRPPVPDATMLRMYMVQICFSLSDRDCEEQVWDSAELRRFVGVAPADVPDATTLCRFRHVLERCGVGEAMMSAVGSPRGEGGLGVRRGTIVDATFIESPSSTKNASGARDPDAHQAKKGQNWHFGYKAGIGVDAVTGVPHSLRVDPANAHDLSQVPDLVREGDDDVWADAGYVGVEERPEVGGDEALSGVEWHVAARRSKVSEAELPEEAAKASARSAVEHPFHIVKDRFGLRKTRLRGIKKVTNQLGAAFAAAAALIDHRGPRPYGPPSSLAPDRVAAQVGRHRARQEKRAAKLAEKARRKAEREAKAEARAMKRLAKAGA